MTAPARHTSAASEVGATQAFREWADSKEASGQEITAWSLEWSSAAHPGGPPFLWVIRPTIDIPTEGRAKSNEIVVGRPDIASVVAYLPAPDPADIRVLLIREVRSPVVSPDGYAWSLPGGSSFEPVPLPVLARQELVQETGLIVGAGRLRHVSSRQIDATLSSYRSHVYALELERLELARLLATKVPHGVEAEQERTWVTVVRLADLASTPVDWATYGAICETLSPLLLGR